MLKNQLFEHSVQFGQGYGAKQFQGVKITVALDGTGDVESIKEAMNMIPAEGGEITIKAGIYLIKEKLVLKSNLLIKGDGNGTVIKTGADLEYWFDLTNKENITIENLCLYLFNNGGDGPIDLDSSNKITFEKILFRIGTNGMDGIFGNSGITGCTQLKINNCWCDLDGGVARIDMTTASQTKMILTGNRFDTIDMKMSDNTFLNCIVKNNFFYDIHLWVGDDNNIIVGNQTDIAITDAGAGNQVDNNVVY